MDIQLYVYDLTKGYARQLSATLIGLQIDAIYHTSIVFEGVEYTYDGGIKTVNPGQTHLGKPIDTIQLGKTKLPMDVILDYLESLKLIFTAPAYDLWTHNCNNFSNDFATFLTGKGIPDYIVKQPQTVLNSPLGPMIKPQVDKFVALQRLKGGDSLLGIDDGDKKSPINSHQSVKKPTTIRDLATILARAEKSCAVIFFASSTSKSAKALSKVYSELAAETANDATLILVDVTLSYELGVKYGVRSTPLFISFLHGQEDQRWADSDSKVLRQNIRKLVQTAWPPHPHEALKLKSLRSMSNKPILYSKEPPLEKLKAKLGPPGDEPAVKGVFDFLSARNVDGAAGSTLPDLDAFSKFLRTAPQKLPTGIMFTIVDLLRLALADPRFSGYFAEEKDHKTIARIFTYVNSLKDCPYSLRLVTLQAACNLFSSPLYPEHILGCPSLSEPIVQLITTSLLDEKNTSVRVAAASLAFNMASSNDRMRKEEHRELLPEGAQVELAASLLEAIGCEEQSPEALKGFLLAFGYLVYCSPTGGEMRDLLKSMDAQGTVAAKKKLFSGDALVKEISEELLGKGME